ncbi:MAG: hypothetical protein KKC11_05975 [Candidatus Omnitrophica bacterium]|nr:hypothetical protein [Candidatus Omnitrophota bacterium]MBU1810885.1 hypothetical protein [Candidatus Omnitrophota bacterium]
MDTLQWKFASNLLFLLLIFLIPLYLLLSYKNKKFILPKFSLKNIFEELSLPLIAIIVLFIYFVLTRKFVPVEKIISSFCAALAILCLLLQRNSLFSVRSQKLINFFTKSSVVIPLVFLFNFWVFFNFFPLKDFNSIVFYDDYPYRLAFLARGVEILKQGALFGWDSKLLGGYPTAFDINDNFSLIFLPFSIFGQNRGFHLMILFFWLSFPFIIRAFILEKFKNKKVANISLYLSFFLNLSFFKEGILYWGMVNNYIAINFFIAALLLALRFKQGKKYSFPLLLLVLFLLMYTHIAIFAFSVIFVSLELIFPLKKSNIVKFGSLIFLLFLATFNYSYYFLKYPSFIKPNTYLYELKEICPGSIFFPVGFNLGVLYPKGANISYLELTFIFLPLLLWCIFKGKLSRKYAYYVFFIASLSCFQFSSVGINNFFHRPELLLPFLLIIIFSVFLKICLDRRNFVFLFILAGAFANIFPSFTSIFHIKDIYQYNPQLISKINEIKEGPILFESRPKFIKPLPEASPKQVHFAGLISQTLKKKLLANTIDGYHYSIFRKNALGGGVFRGKILNQIDAPQFNSFLDKWGVEYMAVWSSRAKNYLGKYPEFYLKSWQDEEWTIFQYRHAKHPNLKFLNNRGRGKLEDLDYFLKILKLKDVKKIGSVILKTNYFPEWRAFYENKEIPVFDHEGQLAIKVPFDGEGTVYLKYSKHFFFTFLIFLSLGAAVIIEKTKWNKTSQT